MFGFIDPTDVALLQFARQQGWSRDTALLAEPQVNAIPFEPEHRFAASFHACGTAGTAVLVKGAPERVLPMCALSPAQQRDGLEQAAALAGQRAEAEPIDQTLRALHRDVFVESSPIPVKWALHEMGMIPPGLRLPLTPLAAPFHETVRDALRQLGVTNVGAFCDLPANGLGVRFGDDVRRMHRLATGDLHVPLQPDRPLPPAVERMELDHAEADGRLADAPLREVVELTRRFRARRFANNAASIDLPEAMVRVVDGEVRAT